MSDPASAANAAAAAVAGAKRKRDPTPTLAPAASPSATAAAASCSSSSDNEPKRARLDASMTAADDAHSDVALASKSTSSASVGLPCRNSDVLPLLRLFFQDPLTQPALQLPYIPSEMLRIIDEYIGPDPPLDPMYYRCCPHAYRRSHDGGLVGCPLGASKADLHTKLLSRWKESYWDEGEDKPSFSELLEGFNNDPDNTFRPWMEVKPTLEYL